MRSQDVENHFVGDGLMALGTDVFTVGGVPVLALHPGYLNDSPLDDVGSVTLDESVYHSGAADQPDLADEIGRASCRERV